MISKKINFGMALQVGLELVRIIDEMEMETMALLLVSFLMIPFILGSLWSLGLVVMWQLLYLGMKAGIVLFLVCSFIMTGIRFKYGFKWLDFMKGRRGFGEVDVEGGAESKPKCCLMDVILSVFFQTGMSVPTNVWNNGIEFLLRIKERKASRLEKKKMLKAIEPSIEDSIRAGLIGQYEYQYGNTFPNEPLSATTFCEGEQTEMKEDPEEVDLTDEIQTNYASFEVYLQNLLSDAEVAEPLPRTRKRIQPLMAKRTGKPVRMTRARKNKA